jgi:flavin reductase (DIM6/NTAB) family NADH-FMN oxidoreductase RutF
MRKVEPSKVYRLLYPSVPAVVAAANGGKTSAMPMVSIMSLSNDPPLIGISSSPAHSTLHAILGARSFSVSWLGLKHQAAVESLGTASGWEVADKLLASGLHYRVKGPKSVPVIAESSAYLVCTVDDVRSYGDHELVVGRVQDARAEDDFDEYWAFKTYRPILYAGLGRPTPDTPRRRVRRP